MAGLRPSSFRIPHPISPCHIDAPTSLPSRDRRALAFVRSRGDIPAMESLQRLLVTSRAAKLLAVRRVSQESSGRKTPGIDGVASISNGARE